jgi:hypothetical protein
MAISMYESPRSANAPIKPWALPYEILQQGIKDKQTRYDAADAARSELMNEILSNKHRNIEDDVNIIKGFYDQFDEASQKKIDAFQGDLSMISTQELGRMANEILAPNKQLLSAIAENYENYNVAKALRAEAKAKGETVLFSDDELMKRGTLDPETGEINVYQVRGEVKQPWHTYKDQYFDGLAIDIEELVGKEIKSWKDIHYLLNTYQGTNRDKLVEMMKNVTWTYIKEHPQEYEYRKEKLAELNPDLTPEQIEEIAFDEIERTFTLRRDKLNKYDYKESIQVLGNTGQSSGGRGKTGSGDDPEDPERPRTSTNRVNYTVPGLETGTPIENVNEINSIDTDIIPYMEATWDPEKNGGVGASINEIQNKSHLEARALAVQNPNVDINNTQVDARGFIQARGETYAKESGLDTDNPAVFHITNENGAVNWNLVEDYKAHLSTKLGRELTASEISTIESGYISPFTFNRDARGNTKMGIDSFFLDEDGNVKAEYVDVIDQTDIENANKFLDDNVDLTTAIEFQHDKYNLAIRDLKRVDLEIRREKGWTHDVQRETEAQAKKAITKQEKLKEFSKNFRNPWWNEIDPESTTVEGRYNMWVVEKAYDAVKNGQHFNSNEPGNSIIDYAINLGYIDGNTGELLTDSALGIKLGEIPTTITHDKFGNPIEVSNELYKGRRNFNYTITSPEGDTRTITYNIPNSLFSTPDINTTNISTLKPNLAVEAVSKYGSTQDLNDHKENTFKVLVDNTKIIDETNQDIDFNLPANKKKIQSIMMQDPRYQDYVDATRLAMTQRDIQGRLIPITPSMNVAGSNYFYERILRGVSSALTAGGADSPVRKAIYGKEGEFDPELFKRVQKAYDNSEAKEKGIGFQNWLENGGITINGLRYDAYEDNPFVIEFSFENQRYEVGSVDISAEDLEAMGLPGQSVKWLSQLSSGLTASGNTRTQIGEGHLATTLYVHHTDDDAGMFKTNNLYTVDPNSPSGIVNFSNLREAMEYQANKTKGFMDNIRTLADVRKNLLEKPEVAMTLYPELYQKYNGDINKMIKEIEVGIVKLSEGTKDSPEVINIRDNEMTISDEQRLLGTRAALNNNPFNIKTAVKSVAEDQTVAGKYNFSYKKFNQVGADYQAHAMFATLDDGFKAGLDYVDRVIKGDHSAYVNLPETTTVGTIRVPTYVNGKLTLGGFRTKFATSYGSANKMVQTFQSKGVLDINGNYITLKTPIENIPFVDLCAVIVSHEDGGVRDFIGGYDKVKQKIIDLGYSNQSRI